MKRHRSQIKPTVHCWVAKMVFLSKKASCWKGSFKNDLFSCVNYLTWRQLRTERFWSLGEVEMPVTEMSNFTITIWTSFYHKSWELSASRLTTSSITWYFIRENFVPVSIHNAKLREGWLRLKTVHAVLLRIIQRRMFQIFWNSRFVSMHINFEWKLFSVVFDADDQPTL